MIDPHCRIGRIRFKSHRGREQRKDKQSIREAKRAMTAALRLIVDGPAQRDLFGSMQFSDAGRRG